MKRIVILLTVMAAVLAVSCGERDGNMNNREDYLSELTKARAEKDAFFANGSESPIPAEEKADFKGLKYYPPDEKYKFTTQIVRYEMPEMIEMLTSTSELRKFIRYGYVPFTIDSTDARIHVYKSAGPPTGDDYYFIPFNDETNGDETYGAGRYLDVPAKSSDIITIDFNEAYNPYCVYNINYSCPIPPAENRLGLPIRAGEKNYKTESAEAG